MDASVQGRPTGNRSSSKNDTKAQPILVDPSPQASTDSYYNHEMVTTNEGGLSCNMCSKSS